jgi:hypothetical protein
MPLLRLRASPMLVAMILSLLLVLAGGCSVRSTLERMTSAEDRAFGQEMVARLRSGDEAWLRQHFDLSLWSESGKTLSQVPGLFPAETAPAILVSFDTSTSMSDGATERQKGFTYVTSGSDRWTVTRFRTYSDGGPDRVVQWQVTPHDEPPPELRMMEQMDAALPWIWGIFAAMAAGLTALIVWLIRRSRRRRAAALPA